MREIKFRVWNCEEKEMRYTRNINGDYDGASRDFHTFSWDSLDSNELIQFTGLKDKNGVDIYEGDIVSYTTNYYNKLRTDNRQVIDWSDDMEHDRFACPLGVGFLLYGYDWEVIGNIYQNPELPTK